MNLPRVVRENRFAVLDLETTGVNKLRDEVVQIAIVQVDHGRPRIRASSYVQPKRIISEGAMAAHGITWDILEHAPTLAEVWPEFRALIGDRCLLGYSIKTFDHPLLTRQLAESGVSFDAPAVDVLAWERKFGGKGRHNLVAAAERWGVPVLPRHEAMADCRMCWNVFVQLASRFDELGSAALEDILDLQPAPPLPENIIL